MRCVFSWAQVNEAVLRIPVVLQWKSALDYADRIEAPWS
jgi:hypothetical protein